MSESARFELVEGATFQLPDGSSVTVRDGGLEMSDGRRLPMPAAGEAITVERTVPRPDGGTTRIKHTIRLSDAEPIVEKPARPFAGAGPGDEEQNAPGDAADGEVGETIPAPASAVVAEAAPKAESEKTDGEKDSGSAAPGPESSSAEVPEDPNKKTTPAAEGEKAAPDTSVTPGEPTLMGVNCGRRSLRAMLWGSIPESGLEDDEDEPKAPPKGLLQKSYSIKEEDESEHEDHEDHEDHEETHEEPLESSENADESFEFVDEKAKGERKDSDSGDKKETEAAEMPNEEKAAEKKPENDSASENVNKAEPVQGDNTKKVTVVTFDTSTKPGDDPQPTDDGADKPAASSAYDSSPKNKPEVEEEPEKESTSEAPGAEFLAEQAAAVMATTASMDQPAPPPAEPQHEKPHLTRQEKLPSSGNLVVQAQDDVVVRVGVPLVDASPEKKPVAAASDTKPDDESAPSPDSEDASSAGARSDEVTNDLHLKLTPILRSLETDEPKSSRSGDNGERTAKKAPSEDRKGTVPPNTPAVAEDRECLLGSDEPEDPPEPVSVPKVVSYFEGISPRSSPAPTRQREPDSSTVPKVIKFAVPMEPEKVYLDGQEPEDMEDTPIPRGDSSKPADSSETPARVELAPEPVTVHQQTLVLVPVRGTPDDVDPLTALAAGETGEQPSPEGRERRESEDPATPSTTPEKDAAPDSGDAPPGDGDTDQQKPGPPVYKPELFEPEPKRPLILTSEMVDEDAPPYEPGVHDARTLPIGRRGNVVTEQPPPFGDDDRSDPRDPFLPDHPRPGHGIKEHGWLNTCFDLCCCCWAP